MATLLGRRRCGEFGLEVNEDRSGYVRVAVVLRAVGVPQLPAHIEDNRRVLVEKACGEIPGRDEHVGHEVVRSREKRWPHRGRGFAAYNGTYCMHMASRPTVPSTSS